MSKPTADWEKLGDSFYRKVQLYTSVFDENVDLREYQISAAPCSGAIALFRDDSRLQTYRGGQNTKSSINIYSCAGRLINRISWDKGALSGLGWSEDERLIAVTRDGTVRIYSGLEGDFTPLTLGHGAEEHGVRSCQFWSTGFVALLSNNQLIAVTNYDEPRPSSLATAPSDSILSWDVTPPAYTLSRSVEALLAIGKSIMTVDATAAEDRMLENGPFEHLAVSPDGKHVAIYTSDGKVWTISSDFQNRISEYDTKVKTKPEALLWCGSDAVILAWEDEIQLVGKAASVIKYYYDSPIKVVSDIDSVKVFTNDSCEMIAKVDQETEDVFRLASTSPAAILLDAMDQLDKKAHKADDNIKLIRSSLDEAVYTCVLAAGQEFSIHWQKQLLKAASYGKSVLDLYHEVDDYVDMCETLRVLNAVRYFEMGLPLTYDQLSRLTPEGLVQRLISRREYLLALKICEYLRLPVDKIYVHWARQKVRKSAGDEQVICKEIVQRLQGKRGISFEEIAQTAFDEGRSKLATELLGYEKRAGKQVPMLLNVGEDVAALDKAIDSGDTDLVFHVLLHLRKKLPLATFFRTINGRPVAAALVEASARDHDQNMLKDFYYQDDRRLDGSNLLISQALDSMAASTMDAQTSQSRTNDTLKSAARILQDSKEHAFSARAVDETVRLLALQDTFERDLGDLFRGLSVNETIFKLIQLGNVKRAARMQTDYKVPERVYWWLRLRALIGRRDWRQLEETSKLKKSPIGWQPFVQEILTAGNAKLASAFIAKCTECLTAERVEMWIKCGLPVQAADEAFKARDRALLVQIRDQSDEVVKVEIERYITQLGGKK